MSIRYFDVGFDRAQARLEREGLEVMRESADAGKDEAQSRARVDERDMKNGIIVMQTPDGARIVATDWKTIWHEYGTGVGAGSHDAQYPDQPGSTGSEAKEIPWVYFNEKLGHFVTTYGVVAQPMMRPGFNVAVDRFHLEKRRRGL